MTKHEWTLPSGAKYIFYGGTVDVQHPSADKPVVLFRDEDELRDFVSIAQRELAKLDEYARARGCR
jgi:hypothetical protein